MVRFLGADFVPPFEPFPPLNARGRGGIFTVGNAVAVGFAVLCSTESCSRIRGHQTRYTKNH
jgi:hypothetical protein